MYFTFDFEFKKKVAFQQPFQISFINYLLSNYLTGGFVGVTAVGPSFFFTAGNRSSTSG